MDYNSNRAFYNLEDFYRLEKIDAHVHINSLNSAYIQQSIEDNFRLLSVNVDAAEFPSTEKQLEISVYHLAENPTHFAFVSAFPMAGWDNPDWVNGTIKYLDQSFKRGAVGIKIWKNIGMEFQDNHDHFIMIDNPRFSPVFDYIIEKNVPLLGHLGEPKDCWLSLEDISIKYIRDYFKSHPQYHMYLHSEFPSYDDQITARDRMLEKNPNLKFLAVHLASLEWDVHQVAGFLDRFPKATVDLSARLMYVQYQSSLDRQKIRNFFLKYQDRIIYGTDIIEEAGVDLIELRNEIHCKWLEDWNFLTTEEIMNSNEFDRDFQGLALPRVVIDKIYTKNAEKLFPLSWKGHNTNKKI
jgi:predicted TIM-barrel fold metal-dependent hydrolase